MVLERLDRVVHLEERADSREKKKPIIAGQEIHDLELEEILVKASQAFRKLLREGQDSISLYRVRFGYLAEIFGMKGQGNTIQTRFESFRDNYLFNFIETHERGKACRFTETQFLAGMAEVYVSRKYGFTDSEELIEKTKEALGPGPITDELDFKGVQNTDKEKEKLKRDMRKLSKDEEALLQTYNRNKIDQMISRFEPYLDMDWVTLITAENLKDDPEKEFSIAPNAVFDRVVEVAVLTYSFMTTRREPEYGGIPEMIHRDLKRELRACLFYLNKYNIPNLDRLREIIYTNIDNKNRNEY